MPMTCAFLNDLRTMDFIDSSPDWRAASCLCSHHGTAARRFTRRRLAFGKNNTGRASMTTDRRCQSHPYCKVATTPALKPAVERRRLGSIGYPPVQEALC